MNKYPKYKPSKIQWLGDIPKHWNVKRIKYLIRKKISDGPHETPEFIEAGIPFLSVDGIQDGELIFEGCRFISETEHKRFQKKTIVEKGDILLGKAASIGKIARVKVDFDFNVWSPLAIIKPNEKINNTFFEHYLKSTLSQYQIEILCTSNTQKNISMDDIPEILVVLPPKEEQTAIANYLDQKTSQLATLIANKQKLIEILKEERTAIINEAVSGKGKNWEKKKLKYVAIVQSSNVDKKSNEDEISVLLCNYIDVYKNEFIVDSISFMKATAKESEIEKFILQEGDVLITKDSETPDDIAKPALVTKDFENVICGYHLAQIRANKKDLTGEFLFRLFQSKDFNCHFEVSANGVTRYGLPLASITDVYISFPSVKEQTEIVKHIQNETQRIDNTISKIEKEICLLQEYKVALISEVVTGKVKVI